MPNFPAAIALSQPLPAYTQQDILDLFDRLLPDHYLAPLKSPGPGYEYLQGVAAMIARVSEAIAHVGNGNYALIATGGSFATATVEFYRATAIHGAVILKAGTKVQTVHGFTYILQDDVSFGVGDLGPHAATVKSLNKNWTYNLPGQFTRSNGEIVPGSIDRISVPLMVPAFGDPTIQVRQTTDAVGGSAAMLDGLGDNRGVYRRTGETDEQYRPRIVFLPEVVSPTAINLAISNILQPFLDQLGQTYTYIETWEAKYQTGYDFPVNVTLSDPYGGAPFSGNVFVYDDPRPPFPFMNRYMDENDYRGAFIVVVPPVPCVADFGMLYDDTAMNAGAFQTPVGRRAITAYNVPSNTSSTVLQGAYDGQDRQADAEKSAIYSGLGAMLEQIKAGGVNVEIVLKGQ